MAKQHRLFISQETIDRWMSDELIEIEGETMTVKADGAKFDLQTAVHFKEEVVSGQDPHDLIGKVKDLEQLAEMGGEHFGDSVVMGDNAYGVAEGFLGLPIPGSRNRHSADTSGSDLAHLARFFSSGT